MTTNDDMNSPEDGGGMMTNDDRFSEFSEDCKKAPKMGAA